MSKFRSPKPRFWVLLMCLTLVIFGALYSAQGRFMVRQTENAAALENLRAEKMEENARLERRIAFTKTDEYVERTARAELGMIKEGEIRFVTNN